MNRKLFPAAIAAIACVALVSCACRCPWTAARPAGVIGTVAAEAAVKDGVREITYEQFMRIRNAGEAYVLLDVLDEDSFAEGRIPGARNFPVGTIDRESAEKMLPGETPVVVYCGSFLCPASTAAAKKLSALGYTVLDYKGGIKEWTEKGNPLER
ncbi:MAG: rhodanese-like domain-containing protein [bacterium]|nr:rhodanese-like domain-containing protein [bacterium]